MDSDDGVGKSTFGKVVVMVAEAVEKYASITSEDWGGSVALRRG